MEYELSVLHRSPPFSPCIDTPFFYVCFSLLVVEEHTTDTGGSALSL